MVVSPTQYCRSVWIPLSRMTYASDKCPSSGRDETVSPPPRVEGNSGKQYIGWTLSPHRHDTCEEGFICSRTVSFSYVQALPFWVITVFRVLAGANVFFPEKNRIGVLWEYRHGDGEKAKPGLLTRLPWCSHHSPLGLVEVWSHTGTGEETGLVQSCSGCSNTHW